MGFLARVSPLGVNQSFSAWQAIGDATAGAAASGQLRFFSDGTVTATDTNQGASDTAGSSNWFLPTTTGIGSSYWIKATLTAGTTPTSGTIGSWTSLSTAQLWQNGAATTSFKSSTLTFQIATDSAGTNIVATYPGNVVAYQHTF